jgi:DNA polymerase (family 10)
MLLETNQKLASIFKEMAAIYKYMGVEERFRSISYNKASRVIESLKEDISEYIKNKKLDDIPGIGKSISEKIIEFVKTGSVKKYEILKKNTPHELIEMMEIRGFGPQSLKKINNELNINTKEQLINALNEGKIDKLKGFGKKKTEGMLRGLKIHKTIENRLLLWNALKIGNQIVEELTQIPEVIHIELAGSLRRKKETIGDIDILISSTEKNRRKIINHFIGLKSVKQILVKGETKASIILKKPEIQVDLRILKDEEWGSALQYFTGSKEHNIHLRSIAKERGYKISEYGVFDINTQKKIAGKTEEDVYNTIGYNLMPAEIREDKGELEKTKNKNIPKLISVKDIKGDLHIHSKWSDGLFSIEEIVKYIKKEYQYEYIIITDHSKSSRIANGMNEKIILKQLKEIETINENLGENFVKSGIEVDILTNGELDISDEVLEQLEWVTASIHSRFNDDNTDRLLKACENKNVNCIGHPTGRLIGTREPYQLDMIKLIDTAKKTNTALEINAQPQRMDLKDDLAMYAREQGVKLVIGSDTHSLQDFEYINLGVYIARRAWCKSSDIINTMSWLEIENWKKLKQKNTTKEILSY